MVVGLAVRMAFPLEEVPRSQFLVAVCAGEVFRMPCLAQGCDHLKKKKKKKIRSSKISLYLLFHLNFSISIFHLADNGLLASIAASLLGGIDSLAAHISL